MKFLSLILLTPVFSACAQVKELPKRDFTIRPGEVRWIEFSIPSKTARLFCRDQEVKIMKKNEVATAIIMESYFSDLAPYSCWVKEGDRKVQELAFKVEERDYKSEKLNVDMKRIKLSPKDQKRADAEQVVLNKIYASSLPAFQFNQAFIPPMTSYITSHYGNRRVYNNHKKSQHLGNDFRAAIGEKVPATNAGKVVFAGDLFYTGWTVIIDHGLDVFSVYGHLSKTLVNAGDTVTRGQVVALSGNTGRSSGPHLHWGVKIQGQYIDGFALVDETKKAFKE